MSLVHPTHRAGAIGADTASTQEAQLQILNEIARIATLDIDLRPMLQRITDAIAKHFGWEFVTLSVLDPERDEFVCEAKTSAAETNITLGYRSPLGSGVVGEVAATGHAVVVDDVRQHGNYVEVMSGARSEICTPIRHKGQVVAILNIESRKLAAFTSQLPLLETIAEQIGGAIANATLYEQLKARARLLEMLSEISRTALEETDIRGVLVRTSEYIHRNFEVEVVSILMHRRDEGTYEETAHAGTSTAEIGTTLPVTSGIAGRAIRTAETQLVIDVRSDPEYYEVNAAVVSELAIPVRFKDQVLAALNLETRSADLFTPTTVRAFEALANQIAGAINLAQALQQLEEAKEGAELANHELATMVEFLERKSSDDGLTGVKNRLHFDHQFKIEWRRAARTGACMSLLMVDVDHFKPYNDTLGHQAGDECLQKIARTLNDAVRRAGDMVARIGGEEFAVLMIGTDVNAAREFADMLRQSVAAMNIPHPDPVSGGMLTISIGVATQHARGDEEGAAELLRQADTALYKAKRAGRNRVVVY